MDTMNSRSVTIGIIAGCMIAALPSPAASRIEENPSPGPGILAVIEHVQRSETNGCAIELTVRRFVLGNPTTYLGESISVCVAEDTPVFTLKFGSRAALEWEDVAQGDLIRFWPEDVMRPTDPIWMRAESVELVEKSGHNPGGWEWTTAAWHPACPGSPLARAFRLARFPDGERHVHKKAHGERLPAQPAARETVWESRHCA